jgi:Ser/Thr protein kinase RdoA (MazF antagonist)
MSFWCHVDADARAGEERPEEAARALATLHAMLADCPLELPLLEPVLGELPRVIGALEATRLAQADLDLLREAFDVVVSRLRASPLPVQVVHGDAHAGNLIHVGREVLWADFEDACSAPFAWDLACLMTPLGAFAGALLEAYTEAGGVSIEMSELDPYLDARALHAAVWWCWLGREDRRRRERAAQWLRYWRERLDLSSALKNCARRIAAAGLSGIAAWVHAALRVRFRARRWADFFRLSAGVLRRSRAVRSPRCGCARPAVERCRRCGT